MRPLLLGLVIAVGLVPQVPGIAQTPTPQKVQLTFEPGGLVTLQAKDATVREVLDEWTRKGGTPFVGAERLTGGAQTLLFEHRPEAEVLTSLLRSASGFVLGPRAADSKNASQFGVVYVVAISNAVASGYTQQSSYTPPPQYTTQGDPGQEIPPVGPGRGGETPQQAAPPPPPNPSGIGSPAVKVIPIGVPTTPTTTPTPTPTPPPGGRGGGGGGR